VKIVNAILGVLTLVVLALAVFVPPAIGRGGTPAERTWQAATVVLLLLAVFAVIKTPRFSIVFLSLSCAFFFVSCTANFHWAGG
jgi:hypothetical protein